MKLITLIMPNPPFVSITPETVKWAYRLFLDREPESEEAVAGKVHAPNTVILRNEFLNSNEFRERNAVLFRLTGYEPALEIEDVRNEEDLEKLFAHIQRTWQQLGEQEPHWSVLTNEEFRAGHVHLSLDKFYASGQQPVIRMLKTLARNQIDHRAFKTCLEFGCGLGRVTRWLAKEFPSVLAYEISKSHLQRARRYFDQEKVKNVTLHQLDHVADINTLPKVDLIYTILVLQHNPPPLIRMIIAQFMRSLRKGGVAIFQVPTYRVGYSFLLDRYLSTRPTPATMELHVVPQYIISDIVNREHGRILEVFEDSAVGSFSGISNSFLVQKLSD